MSQPNTHTRRGPHTPRQPDPHTKLRPPQLPSAQHAHEAGSPPPPPISPTTPINQPHQPDPHARLGSRPTTPISLTRT